MQNNIFTFGLTIAIMLVGMDFLTRVSGPRAHATYRRVVRRIYTWMSGHVRRLLRRIWANYRQFILGVGVGILLALYFTGHFQ